LEPAGDGTFLCGLVLHPTKYIDLGGTEGWKDEFLGGVFEKMLGIGMGCCTSKATLAMAKRMTEFHKKRVTYRDVIDMQMEEMKVKVSP
jgi:hypothetical protein